VVGRDVVRRGAEPPVEVDVIVDAGRDLSVQALVGEQLRHQAGPAREAADPLRRLDRAAALGRRGILLPGRPVGLRLERATDGLLSEPSLPAPERRRAWTGGGTR